MPFSSKVESEWLAVVGCVTGTYISAKTVTTIIVGCLMFATFAAIMIALILR